MQRSVDKKSPRSNAEERPVRQIDELYGYGRSWREIADEMERGGPKPADSAPQRLCDAESADEVVRVVLEMAAEQLASCILFRVKDGMAEPWVAQTYGRERPLPKSAPFPVASGTPFELLAIHTHYRGPVPPQAAYREFFAGIGRPVPHEIVLLPIHVGGKMVAVLYGDGGPVEGIRPPIEEQMRLQTKLTLGLTLVLIKNKLQH